MTGFFKLLKGGNKPSFVAAVVNTFIGLLKMTAYLFTGNVAMFAEMMHSFGDAANQYFVFIGSALSKKAPTDKFPNGFGRVVNLACLGAVIIVGILSYETVKEGLHHLLHPIQSSGVLISLGVLGIGVILELYVFYKAAVEVLHESGEEAKGFSPFIKSFTHLNRAKPATKLVFMEDLVATSGGVIAIIAITITYFTGFGQAEGIASITIGLMMFYVVGRVFLENARGAIGETDEEMREHIAGIVLADPKVKDIRRLQVIKEGESLHVEIVIEVNPALTIAEADDIKDRLALLTYAQKGVAEVTIEFDEDDQILGWS
ncbi:cation diffusion facilitator family transporter [Jeotgalibacillus proteolyticus]|uniref:Cation diffusion facilitator family transporter n=1 Tax=Jeotgalibacillus proteolyticus TaxID=2082395 RepID=A0A2S5G7J2_9BACL|nr:cation diffusion facilitator family transporter [Jeotgalibacillus proteolyticus]PPA68913.1 cation diffusion facilitator family transporter [Jeotgalibacillus proteolyticus]